MTTEARLIEVETKLAYLEDSVTGLSDVLARQQREIDLLQASLKILVERFGQLAAAVEASNPPRHELPPHY